MNTQPKEPIVKTPKTLMNKRAWNIAFRTAHLGVGGVLVGGHVFDIERERLELWLYLTIVTGLILTVIEAYPRIRRQTAMNFWLSTTQ